MTVRSGAMRIAEEEAVELQPLRTAVLLRVAVATGAARTDLVRDLAPLLSHKLSPAALRERVDGELQALAAAGLVVDAGPRITTTHEGATTARDLFGARSGTQPSSWADMRDQRLVGLALGMAGEGAAKLKALSRPDGLRAVVLQKAYGLPFKANATSSRLRSSLAVVALERAFGNKIKSGLGTGSGLPAKASRLLAGQLSSRPRDFGTDNRLIAALAAEASGAIQTDADALRTAILRRWIGASLEGSGPAILPHPVPVPSQRPAETPAPAHEPANDRGLAPLAAKASPRPDLKGFAAEVLAAARPRAEGWPGNRKTFISLVWQAIRARWPDWGLTEIEFKCMLAEAHKAGLVVLANADIKDKRNIKELQDSAVAYKNTVWHFVRVED